MAPKGLKERYGDKWPVSVLRERLVLAYLNMFLPRGFRAVLVGFGAGSVGRIDGGYNGLGDAFDIAVFFHGDPVALVDVTGFTHRSVKKKRLGYCAGEWKLLDKAERYGVLDRLWIAFVVEGESTILWAPATKFLTDQATPARLYEDEREVLCLPREKWHPFDNPKWDGKGKIPFKTWLEKMARLGPTPQLRKAFARQARRVG